VSQSMVRSRLRIVHALQLPLAIITISLVGCFLQTPCLQAQESQSFFDAPAAEVRASQMAKTITIYRDKYGVPHIYAPTDAACIFGFVYAQAEDYFWQVEDSYLRALGRAAEVYGEKELANDLVNQALQISDYSKQEYARAEPRSREFYQAMADGLNYFLSKHPEVKPRAIQRYEPWHALALGRFLLYQSFIYRKSGLNPNEILKAVRETTADTNQTISLLPQTLDWIAQQEQAEQDQQLLSQHVGSNMWAVRPGKAANAKALLLINPHQPFFGPGQWYEGHLVSEQGWDLTGACLFGAPFPSIGHNQSLAWSHTVNEPNVTSVYRMTFDQPEQPLSYRYGDQYKQASELKVTIGVKTSAGSVQPRKFTILKTHLGPIVAKRDDQLMAIRLAKIEEGGALEQWYAMGRAKNIAEFKQAMQVCNVPMFNAIAADNAGDIFYVYGAAIPKRDPKFDWFKPVDGSDPATQWQGYHGFAELPQTENPQCGFLQNCNQSPWTTTSSGKELADGQLDENPQPAQYPSYMVGEKNRDNGRARISRRILANGNNFDFESWSKLAFDTRIIEAEDKIPDLVREWEALSETEPQRAARLRDAVELLRRWDCVSTTQSVEMTLFSLTYERVMQMLAKRDLLNSPRIRALESTISELEKQFDTWRVGWGQINRLQRIHGSDIDGQGSGKFSDDLPSLPVAGAPGTVGVVFNFYAQPQPGQKLRYGVAGHSFVGVVELNDKVRAKSVLQFGQSADPKSTHWFDQGQLYARGEFKPAWYTVDEVQANSSGGYHP
jgi:acyl-homoserine-lactone acylase